MGLVRIEFAGMCIAAYKQMGPTSVSVILPHTRGMGGPSHTPVLLTEDTGKVVGSPHFTVTVPAGMLKKNETEFAGWRLRGEVRLSGDLGAAFAVDTTAVNAGDKRKDFKSVGYLLPLHTIAGGTALADRQVAPVAATVVIERGTFRSLTIPGVADALQLEAKHTHMSADTVPVEVIDTLVVGRFAERGAVEFRSDKGFQVTFDAVDGSREVLSVSPRVELTTLVVSNLSSAQQQPHFGGYLACVDGERHGGVSIGPIAVVASGEDPPHRPEECFCMRMELA